MRKRRDFTTGLVILLAVALVGPLAGALDLQVRQDRQVRRGWGPRVACAAQDVDSLVRALQTAPAVAARAQAATALGRMGDRQAVPALIQAMIEDQAAPVRGTCAEVLGRLADPASRAALRAALQDPDPAVRDKAQRALSQLGPNGQLALAPAAATAPRPAGGLEIALGPRAKPLQVALGRMGTKARGAPPELVNRLRDALNRELSGTPGVQVMSAGAGGYIVDSSITELTRRTMPTGEVEISCEVSVVIGVLPTHAIVGVTSGGATVSSPRRMKPSRAALQELEASAVNSAVRGAHQNLVAFLRSRK